MLAVTPDAFDLAYSLQKGIRFLSALAVRSLKTRELFDLYDISPMTFFEKHLQSFIGDQRLDKPDIAVLNALSAEAGDDSRPSAHIIHLMAEFE